jgi:hypothetical protein
MFDLLLNNVAAGGENDENSLESKNITRNQATDVRRVNSANYNRGLTVLLDVAPDDYFITTGDFEGFKVCVFQKNVAFPTISVTRKVCFEQGFVIVLKIVPFRNFTSFI